MKTISNKSFDRPFSFNMYKLVIWKSFLVIENFHKFSIMIMHHLSVWFWILKSFTNLGRLASMDHDIRDVSRTSKKSLLPYWRASGGGERLTDCSSHHWSEPTSRFKTLLNTWTLVDDMFRIAHDHILHMLVHFIVHVGQISFFILGSYSISEIFRKSKIQKINDDFHPNGSPWTESLWYFFLVSISTENKFESA